MAPVQSHHEAPSNIAQLGMGWNIATGTIDLGLTFFDAIFVVKDWIRDFLKHKALRARKEELIRKGKRIPQRRSIQLTMTEDYDDF
jgi:hypothetical protein